MSQPRRPRLPAARARAAVAVLAACATAAAPHALAAQLRPVSLGISGGIGVPQGDGADAVENGYVVGAHLRIAPPALPVGFRADVNWSRNDAKLGDGYTNILSGFANATLRLAPAAAVLRPYVVGGVGMGRFTGQSSGLVIDDPAGLRAARGPAVGARGGPRVAQVGGGESDAETAFGWQAGGGLELPLVAITVFAEATYQRFTRDGASIALVPVRVGLRF